MLSLLRTALAGDRSRPDGRREPGQALPYDYSTLSNPATILRLLNQLHFSRSKVTFHAENETGVHSFNTSIVRVQRKERGIVLHRPEPQDWQRVIVPGTQVEVNCFLPSGQLSFFSRLWPLGDSGSSGFCTLTLPAEVTRFQLRSAYRVFVPPGCCSARVRLPDAGNGSHACNAVVLDLSALGCGLRFATDLGALLPQGGLAHARFELQDGSFCFETGLRICRSSSTRAGQSLAGMQFLPLPPDVARRLQGLLAELQRQQLRRQVQIF